MKDIYLYITGEPVTKKNNRPIYVNKATGSRFLGKSKKLTAAEKDICRQIQSQHPQRERYAGAVSVTFQVFCGSKRRKDLSNCWEIYADCLQTCGIILDDDQIVHLDMFKWGKGTYSTQQSLGSAVSILIRPTLAPNVAVPVFLRSDREDKMGGKE